MLHLSITIMPNMGHEKVPNVAVQQTFFNITEAWPFLPYIFLMLFFNMSIASSKGITCRRHQGPIRSLKGGFIGYQRSSFVEPTFTNRSIQKPSGLSPAEFVSSKVRRSA